MTEMTHVLRRVQCVKKSSPFEDGSVQAMLLSDDGRTRIETILSSVAADQFAQGTRFTVTIDLEDSEESSS